MRYLCCRYCVAERVIGIFLSTSQSRISHSLSLDSSPPISGCSSEPTPDLPHSVEWRLPRSIRVSRPPRVSGEIYTHPRARAHTHTHAHTPIYRRVRGFSLPEGWGSFDLLSGRAKSGISMKSAVGISASNLSPSTYLCAPSGFACKFVSAAPYFRCPSSLLRDFSFREAMQPLPRESSLLLLIDHRAILRSGDRSRISLSFSMNSDEPSPMSFDA